MSVLRSCYTTTGRLYRGGPPVNIRWYWADEGAPVYDGRSCWEPELYFEQDIPRPDGPGELPGAPRYYYKGANPGITTQPHWCGTESDFLGFGSAPVLPNGRPDFGRLCACATPPCIGWGPSGVSPSSYHGFLRLDGTIAATVFHGAAGTGEVRYEGTWSLVPPPPLSFVGELYRDGEYTVHESTLVTADGELSLEAEWQEGDTGILDFVGDLDFDAEFVEGEPFDVNAEGELSLEGECESGTADGHEEDGELYLEGEATVDVFPIEGEGDYHYAALWDEGPFAFIDEADFAED